MLAPDMGHISKLRAAVAETLHLIPEQLVLAEIWQHKFHRLLPVRASYLASLAS